MAPHGSAHGRTNPLSIFVLFSSYFPILGPPNQAEDPAIFAIGPGLWEAAHDKMIAAVGVAAADP